METEAGTHQSCLRRRNLMGNTFFYRQVDEDSSQITWKDIFSECRKKHTRQELEYAMTAGTVVNSATEEDMLKKWQKPWVFYPLLKGGLLLVALLYAIFFATLYVTGSGSMASLYMVIIIPPIVMPAILMIFLWELNIPKNISIYELLAVFLLGGFISFAVTMVMYLFVGEGPGIFAASFAAFREEPAKLAAAVLFLFLFKKNKKIYGLTGLVVGAAVGAGFGAFESVEYAFSAFFEGNLYTMIYSQILRGIFAIGGHVLYAAPYTAALALAARESGLKAKCLLDRDFLLLFLASVALHFCWNADIGGYPKYIAIIVVLWVELLYIVKKCLQQAVSVGHRCRSGADRYNASAAAGLAAAGTIRLVCVGGDLRGAVWDSDGGQTLHIGRGEGNQLRFPAAAKGVSRNHCSVCRTAQGWVVRDEGSTYGTYVNQGEKLVQGLDHVLVSGDRIYLGGRENVFEITLM